MNLQPPYLKMLEWESLPNYTPHNSGQTTVIGCQLWKPRHNLKQRIMQFELQPS